ncbi:hypothetical protein SALBM311S_01266 [Streptomyces alboniger]
MLLSAVGNIGLNYIAPLIVAKLVGRIADDPGIAVGATLPYVLGFAGVLLLAEALWRIGLHCLNRLDAHGIEHLYVIGMDELFAKDAAFFHDNFAGSLTKRVLSFASRFENFIDTLTFQVVGSLVPLAFGSVVLWRYEPLLVAGLLTMIALHGLCAWCRLIRRRQALGWRAGAQEVRQFGALSGPRRASGLGERPYEVRGPVTFAGLRMLREGARCTASRVSGGRHGAAGGARWSRAAFRMSSGRSRRAGRVTERAARVSRNRWRQGPGGGPGV